MNSLPAASVAMPGQASRRVVALLALTLSLVGNAQGEATSRVCPVVLGGPNYPVLSPSLPGLWTNLSGGFENGVVVKTGGMYHMITTGWSAGTYSHDIIVQFSSPDRHNWTFGGQVAGCHWENGQWYNPVAQPALHFNNQSDHWELFHIWCIEPKVSWSPNCTCVRSVSTVPGRSGITGPWVEAGIVLSPKGAQPWQDGTLDSISNPFAVGGLYYVFIGSGGACGWCVGLAYSSNMSGPFERVANSSATPLINGTLTASSRGYNENPLVLRLPSGVYVAVFDFLKPEVTVHHDDVFGFSYSSNGVDWPAENGVAMSLLPPHNSTAPLWATRARTPLSLIDEGDGSYTMFYTGFAGATAAVSYVSLRFETVPVRPPPPPPQPPSPPGPRPFVPWFRDLGVSVVYGVPITGQPNAPLLGKNVTTEAECRALCTARANCTMYTGSYGGGAGKCNLGEWCWMCFGRTDNVWQPKAVPGFVSARRVEVPVPRPLYPQCAS